MAPKQKQQQLAALAAAPPVKKEEAGQDAVPAQGKPEKAYPPMPPGAAKDVNYKLKALAKKGDPELLNAYQACRSQQLKREFYFDRFLLDPRTSTRSAKKSARKLEEEAEEVQKGWWTGEQIADFKGISPHRPGYEDKVIACIKGLPERAHEDPELAKIGVLQYFYEHRVQKERSSKQRLVELEETVTELEQDDFEEAKRQLLCPSKKMLGSSNTSSSSQSSSSNPTAAPALPAGDADPEKAYKEAYQKVKSSINGCSALLNKANLTKARIEAITEPAKAGLQEAYSKELDKLIPILTSAQNTCVEKLAAYAKEVGPGFDVEQPIKDLTILKDNLEKHKKAFTQATTAIFAWC